MYQQGNGPGARSYTTNYCRRVRWQVHDLHVEYEWSLADECTASRVSAYDYAATCCPNCRQPRQRLTTLATRIRALLKQAKIYLFVYLFICSKLFEVWRLLEGEEGQFFVYSFIFSRNTISMWIRGTFFRKIFRNLGIRFQTNMKIPQEINYEIVNREIIEKFGQVSNWAFPRFLGIQELEG